MARKDFKSVLHGMTHYEPDPQADYKLEQMIGSLLRAGVFIAAAVVLLGGILYLAQYGSTHPAYHAFHGESSELRSVTSVVKDAARLDSRSIIQLGLFLLVLTPIARVVFSAVGFALERDYVYVVITVFVLAVLLVSLMKIR